jgi:hypothetical protein
MKGISLTLMLHIHYPHWFEIEITYNTLSVSFGLVAA